MTTFPYPGLSLHHDSGVGVLDKASHLLSVLEAGPASVSRIVAVTGLTRPTAYRLALALQRLRLVTRDAKGRYHLGPRLSEMATLEHGDRMLSLAGSLLPELRARTAASARIYRRCEEGQLCVAAAEIPKARPVPVGTALMARSGATAQVLIAWEEPETLYKGLMGARFTADTLIQVRRRGWSQSFEPADDSTATLAAPVRGPGGRVVAALALTGQADRLTGNAARQVVGSLIDAALRLGEVSGA
ncbi:IclR family transcriptional regulator [Streptomyces fimicarius]|uniref:IclR family transcriptional regulator n=1 Tax=Streptomyces griseus TaxID=1911 RepID=UPI003681E4DA